MKIASAKGVVNSVWRLFISLRLTFVLLGLISLGAVIGMSFDQTVTFDEFYQKRPDAGLGIFFLSFFELYDAFHSWWFSLAILLLSANLVACSIERLPRIFFDWRRPRPYLTKRRLLGLTLKEKTTALSQEQAEALVGRFLQTNIERARLSEGAGYFYRERQGLSRFGVYVVHIALLIVMFSSVYATEKGVDGQVMIEEGKKARFITARGAGGVSYTYDLGFYVGCDDFRLRTFVDNSPMEYESDLYISRDRMEKTHQKTVRVNEPLSYAGFTFYQSSFQPVISEKIVEIEVADNNGYKKRHRVRLNSPIELPDGNTLVVEKVFEDFAGLGQALRLVKKSADGNSTYFHIFRRHKDYDGLVRADKYAVTFLEADQQYATGLSVGKVPGISVIFSGFLLLTLGLYMCFFMNPVRYFAHIVEENGEIEVWLAAQGFRNPGNVREMFVNRLALANQQIMR